MRVTKISVFIFTIFLILGTCAAENFQEKNSFLVLCYHDIPKDVHLDNHGVDRAEFVKHIEYLRAHGFNFISLEDVMEANRGEKILPERSVLLTFDDAYLSFYEFVYPLLELYGYPCVLAVVTSWIDNPPLKLKLPLMDWDQLRETADAPLVEIASHTHDLHHGILYNPQGNKAAAVSNRIYDPETKNYENENAYRRRLYNDFSSSVNVLKEKLGMDVRVMVWPYGEYNQISIEEAEKAGFKAMFTLDVLEDKLAQANSQANELSVIHRYIIEKNPSIEVFAKNVKQNFTQPVQLRILHADLDLVYDPDPIQRERNLDQFIERVFNMKVSTVYLQAFSDDKGDGNISSVYFPNRVLPMKADFFNRVTDRLSVRGIRVYAWMPMLSITLPDEEENEDLRVRKSHNGKIEPSSSWYKRLSPFSPETHEKLAMLYEDMAINARINGVVFNDDGYLNQYEDFHPMAYEEYQQISGGENIPYEKLSPELKRKWTSVKTRTLIELTEELKKAVLRHRPESVFVRTLYAPVLTHPESEEWFAQNYAESLDNYDYVVIMAYPRMEKARNPAGWLKELVKEAGKYRGGIQKTVFKVQTYDWNEKKWIKTKTVNKWLRILVAAGAMHIAYYPDNCIGNKPDERIIREMMSVEDFPFKRK